ncbi:MAG: hypothetical protein KJ559_02460 [Nanoarchaeota archaeon]|nr:hypothetical protein [Nanoarchaeota archaeon]
MLYKRGQITIYVIIAIIIVASVTAFFMFKQNLFKQEIPVAFEPVENYYLSCIEESLKAGVSVMQEQGGYIYLPEFVPGSSYMPTSNYLDFFGSPVAYWYYVSGNNIIKEQIPTKSEMEKQLERYLEEIMYCELSSFGNQGFAIDVNFESADVKILDGKIKASVVSEIKASFGDESVLIKNHDIEINSKLSKFYELAKKVYDYESRESFLEKYSLDVLHLYAPVDGAELTCSPKIWIFQNVQNTIKQALEANIMMIKLKGDYYDSEKADNYFITDLKTDENIRFLYSSNWPTKIETQDKDGVLIAEPVGNSPGMGVLGFCYISYHFVYDMVFPVLIQIYDNNELFQFPVAVVIKGNKEREALPGSYVGDIEPVVCKYKNQEMNIYTYNSNLEPLEADISFKCFNEMCDIGKTSIKDNHALLNAGVPQCVNGFMYAEAEGYKRGKVMVSTNEEIVSNIILDKLYNIDLELKLGRELTYDSALIYFQSDEHSATVVWPEQKQVELAEGFYNVSASVYRNSSIFVPGTKTQKCIEVEKPGFLGIFGKSTDEQCFDLEIPSQTISNAIAGGGKVDYYFTQTELEKGKMDVFAEKVSVPKSFEDMQKSYDSLETKKLYMEFK